MATTTTTTTAGVGTAVIVVGAQGLDTLVEEAREADLVEMRRGMLGLIERHRGPLVYVSFGGEEDEGGKVLEAARGAGACLAVIDPDSDEGPFEGDFALFLPWLGVHLRRQGTKEVVLVGFWDDEGEERLSVAELLDNETDVADIRRIASYLQSLGLRTQLIDELIMTQDTASDVEDEDGEDDEDAEDDEDGEDEDEDEDEDDEDEDDEGEEGEEGEDEVSGG